MFSEIAECGQMFSVIKDSIDKQMKYPSQVFQWKVSSNNYYKKVA